MSNMTEPSATDGKKYDQEKPRVGLMVNHFPRALTAVARCDTMGAKKYGDDNLFTVPQAAARYLDAAYRHLLAHGQGESSDPESGESHLAHAAWNILAVLEMRLRAEEKLNPLPSWRGGPPAAAADEIAEWRKQAEQENQRRRDEKIRNPGFYFAQHPGSVRVKDAGKEFK